MESSRKQREWENEHAMFPCGHCGEPMTAADILDLGLRLPEVGESAEEYMDAELLDGLQHRLCPAALAG